MNFGTGRIGREMKLFPLPTYHGELEKWEDWSWQLTRYFGLYKPVAKHGDREASDSGRFARQFCVMQTLKCAKRWFLHIFARATTYMEEGDPREGSFGMGHFVRFTVVLKTL